MDDLPISKREREDDEDHSSEKRSCPEKPTTETPPKVPLIRETHEYNCGYRVGQLDCIMEGPATLIPGMPVDFYRGYFMSMFNIDFGSNEPSSFESEDSKSRMLLNNFPSGEIVNEPGEKVLTFSSARLEETHRVSSNEPYQAKLDKLDLSSMMINKPPRTCPATSPVEEPSAMETLDINESGQSDLMELISECTRDPPDALDEFMAAHAQMSTASRTASAESTGSGPVRPLSF
jgi:hypothetical protein